MHDRVSAIRKPRVKDVKAIAREAGNIILEELRALTDDNIEYKSNKTPVTTADMKSHEHIVQKLATLTPNIPVLSEEGTDEEHQKALASPVHWAVDPLDGTRAAIAYAKGDTQENEFGVHIALIERGVPTMGVIYYPAQELMYFTADNGKAYRENRDRTLTRLQVAPPEQVKGDTLKTGVSWDKKRQPETLLGRRVKGMPVLGAGRMLLVAMNWADAAFMEHSGEPMFTHDIAAGHAILRAAGGELVGLPDDAALRSMPDALAAARPVRYHGVTTVPYALAASEKVLVRKLGMPAENLDRSGHAMAS